MHAPLPDTWMQWLADNRLRDCDPESLVRGMVAGGIDARAARAAVLNIEKNPVFLAARKHQQLTRKLESLLANQQKLLETAPDYGDVERRSGVTADEFYERHARAGRPVLLEGITDDWRAMQDWSPFGLLQRLGIESTEPSHVSVGSHPALAPVLEEGVGSLPPFCDRARLGESALLWIVPQGHRSSLSHEASMLLHTQVYGRARWRLISPFETPRLYNYDGMTSGIDLDQPDLARYPLCEHVRTTTLLLEPGDTLFLPLAWWHQVTTLDDCVSLSYGNLGMPNEFRYANPSIKDW